MRFGCWTKYRYELQGRIYPKRPLKMGLIGCPETSVTNCHHTLRNITEERRSHMCKMFRLKMNFPISYVRPKHLCWHYCRRLLQGVCLFLFELSTRRTNYPNIFCYKTLHVSGIFSSWFCLDTVIKTYMKLTSAECTVENFWRWAENMPETCRVL